MTQPAPPVSDWPRLPRSQADAKRKGSRCYYTAVVCQRGHLAARWTRTGACIICNRKHGARSTEDRVRWERWGSEETE